jgi:hypothetical protein
MSDGEVFRRPAGACHVYRDNRGFAPPANFHQASGFVGAGASFGDCSQNTPGQTASAGHGEGCEVLSWGKLVTAEGCDGD